MTDRLESLKQTNHAQSYINTVHFLKDRFL